ncbi:MAG: hypothetical protein WBF79_00950, partial [Rhodococcus sp. (in: high G+C Gram-positive bacteria)]
IGHRAAASTAAITGVLFAAAAGAFALGANPTALAAWSSVALVLVLIVTPKSALSTSGLLALIKSTENADLAEREAVRVALRKGRETTDVMVWSTAVMLMPLVLTVCFTGVWSQGLLCAVLCVVVLLRSRSFTHARHVGPLISAATIGILGGAAAIPRWFDHDASASVVLWCALVVVALLSAAASQTAVFPDVGAARVRRTLDIVDVPLALAYIPVLFLAQGLYGYFWP